MQMKQFSRCMVAIGVIYGLSACSEFRVGKRAAGKTVTQTSTCPAGIEGKWHVRDGKNETTVTISKKGEALTFDMSQFDQPIVLDGQVKKVNQNSIAGFQPEAVEVTGIEFKGVVYLSVKYTDGSVSESEWRMDGDEGSGNVTVKRDEQTEILIMSKDLSCSAKK